MYSGRMQGLAAFESRRAWIALIPPIPLIHGACFREILRICVICDRNPSLTPMPDRVNDCAIIAQRYLGRY